MKILRLKRALSLSILAAMTGCAVQGIGTWPGGPTSRPDPGDPAAGPGSGSAAEPGLGGPADGGLEPVDPGREVLRLADMPADTEFGVIVRYREGREPAAQAMGSGWRRLGLDRTAVYRAGSAEAQASAIARLARDPDVEYVEPDYPVMALMTVNDPQVGQQWPVEKIQLPAAWDLTMGARTVKVAVVDTGIDSQHPDLAGQVVGGRDFVNNDSDPDDDMGHGTHVAGTIAALTNNGVGVAGIAGGASLLAVKVLGSNGSGTVAAIADGINYAVQQGAKVINLSLGSPQSSTTLASAINSALAAGVTVVAAAGNDGTSTPMYPAAIKGVIAVGATDSSDNRSSFSNYGSWVTVAAPGSNILSTYPGGRYQAMNGTSMASPHVAGVAALVRSRHPDWSASQVKAAIETTGDPVRGFEGNLAIRRVNALKALGGGNPAPAPSVPPSPGPTAPPGPAPAPSTAPTGTPTLGPTSAPPPAPPGSDSRAPAIGSIGLSGLSSTAATIRFATDEWARGRVYYGTSFYFMNGYRDDAGGTTHAIGLVNLRPGTYYYVRIQATDAAGNRAMSATYRFRTAYY